MELRLRTLRNFAKAALISLSVSLAVLILLEISLRLLFPQSVTTRYEGGRPLAAPDPVLGYALNPNSASTVDGPEYTVQHRINQDGLRDRGRYSSTPSGGTVRILLLGDSFAFGYGTPYEAIWPVVLERRLQEEFEGVEIVKAGVPGYDTRHEVLLLKKIYPEYRPDIVVLCFLPNDLFTNVPLASSSGVPVVVSPAEKESALHSLLAVKRALMASDWIYTRFYLLTPRGEFFRTPMSRRLQESIEVTKQLLLEARDFCARGNTQFLVVSIPQRFQVVVASRNYQMPRIDIHLIDRALRRFAKQEGFRWLSMLGTLAEARGRSRRDLYYRLDGHLNTEGNRLIGESLAREFLPVLKANSDSGSTRDFSER